MQSNIILIGMPASGKSTLGVVLAKILGMSFVDADLLIQNHMGKRLQGIIDERGAQGFIDVENSVLKGTEFARTVLATGGSAVYSDQAMQQLKELGVVVYLEISFDELVDRLGNLDQRGVVFKDGLGGDLRALYDERTPLYEKYADITVNVTGTSIREAALMVSGQLCEKYPESFTLE